MPYILSVPVFSHAAAVDVFLTDFRPAAAGGAVDSAAHLPVLPPVALHQAGNFRPVAADGAAAARMAPAPVAVAAGGAAAVRTVPVPVAADGAAAVRTAPAPAGGVVAARTVPVPVAAGVSPACPADVP